MPSYLSADLARQRLIQSGKYTADTVPNGDVLEFLIDSIEPLIDGWLGWNAAPNDYEEIVNANAEGIAFLKNVPVLLVKKVTYFRAHRIGIDPVPLEERNTSPLWLPGRDYIEAGRAFGEKPLQINYRAGYDPLPKVFGAVVFQALSSALTTTGTTGDLSFLDNPTRQVSSLSLPGGLTKSFSYGSSGGGKSSGGSSSQETELDRLLKPLERFRRRFVL